MKKQIAACWRAHGPVITAAAAALAFAGLFLWRFAAGAAAPVTLTDLAGDRAALESFPLAFDLRDELHTRTVALHDGRPVSAVRLTEPLYDRDRYIHTPGEVNVPNNRGTTGVFHTAYAGTRTGPGGAVEHGVYLYLNFYPRSSSFLSADASGAGVFTGLYTQVEDPDQFSFYADAHTAFLGNTLYYIFNTSGPDAAYHGENRLFRLELNPDAVRPKAAPVSYAADSERPLEFGGAVCVASIPGEAPVLGLERVGDYLLLLTREQGQTVFTLLDSDGARLDRCAVPMRDGQITYRLDVSDGPRGPVCAAYLARYGPNEPWDADDAQILVFQVGETRLEPLLSFPASRVNQDLVPLNAVYFLSWRDGKLLVAGMRGIAPEVTCSSYDGVPVSTSFGDVYAAVFAPDGTDGVRLLYAGQLITGAADDNKAQIQLGGYYEKLASSPPPYLTRYRIPENFRLEGGAV